LNNHIINLNISRALIVFVYVPSIRQVVLQPFLVDTSILIVLD